MKLKSPITLDNGSLSIHFKDYQTLYDTLRLIAGYTEQDLADKFELSLSSVQNWTKKDRNPTQWILIYLIETIELKLSLIGYMLKHKKASFVIYGIKQVQGRVTDLKLSIENLPQSPIYLEIGNLITEDKAIDTSIISNMVKTLELFEKEITPK